MEDFKVITKSLQHSGSDLIQMSRDIRTMGASISTIRTGLRSKIVREEDIGRRLRDITNAVDQINGKLAQYGDRAMTIGECYNKAEQKITGYSRESVTKAVEAGIGVISNLAAGAAPDQTETAPEKNEPTKEAAFIKGEVNSDGKILGMDSHGEAKGDILGAFYKNEFESGIKWDYEKDKDGNMIRKLSDVTLLSVAIAGEGHLISGSASGNIGLLRGEAHGSVGKVSSKGEVKAALIQDGKLAPQLQAKAEVSAVGAEGDASAGLGTENNNVHVKAEGKLGSATAYAEGAAGKITYETKSGETKTGYGGKWGAGAEAYLAEGSVSGGINILGVQINLEVGGKAGGAGGKIGGYATTGGVSGSISAGLGLGFELGLDIDWSGFKFGW